MQEIFNHQRQIINNILVQFGVVNQTPDAPASTSEFEKAEKDELQKGEILDRFGYGYGSGNQPLTFKKTGKWLKENLPAVILRLETLKADIIAKQKALAETVGVAPSEIQTSYNIKTLEILRYPYEMCYPPKNDSLINSNTVPDEATVACRKFNDLCYILLSVMEDISCCKVIMAGVEDKSIYPLTVSQLVALGFQDAMEKGEVEDFVLDDAIEKSEGNHHENVKKIGNASKDSTWKNH